MKKRIFIVLLLLLVVGIWLGLRQKRPAQQVNTELAAGETNQVVHPLQARPGQTATAPAPAPVTVPNPSAQDGAAVVESRIEQIKEEVQKGYEEWKTPIEFYGKVVDENTNSVEGAQIDFDCNDLSSNGTSFYHTQSDPSGLFSIRNIKGKLLGVKVNKQGYYSYQPFGADFYYAGQNQNFAPDAANPVILRLKKKGVAEPLVHVQAPMGGAKGFRVAREGTAVEISLMSGKPVPPGQGDLRVQCWTDDQSKARGEKYDWKCQITIPNGGLVRYEDEFPFKAPLAGYQPSNGIDMPANLESGWGRSARRNYFVKLANGNYARMSFEMVAGGDHFFRLESFLNPSGSRNLEFDPQIAINP